ncbi:MAG: hypothetical protein GY851_02330, partial [bacterium]|nr:hypothetical protein [bacterium]
MSARKHDSDALERPGISLRAIGLVVAGTVVEVGSLVSSNWVPNTPWDSFLSLVAGALFSLAAFRVVQRFAYQGNSMRVVIAA